MRDIPIPPGAETVFEARNFHLSLYGFRTTEMYKVKRSVPELVAFYKLELMSTGWVLSKEQVRTEPSHEVVCLVFARDTAFRTAAAAVELIGDTANSNSVTTVTVDTEPYRDTPKSCR
jgi:hypothetical protein